MKKDLLKFMKTLDVKDLPESYRNNETNSLYYKSLCVKRELLRGSKTKEDIKLMYDVDDYVINSLMGFIYSKSFEVGELINNKFKNQRNMTKDYDMNKIVEELEDQDNKVNEKFDINKRVNFANYMYNNTLVDTFKDVVIDNFYSKLPNDSNEFKIRAFACKEFDLRSNRFVYSRISNDFDFKWLELFDINDYFDIKDGKINATHKYKVNNELKEITFDRTLEVMKSLSDNKIPLADCIVKEALKRDLYNELDEFIIYLVGYKRTRVRSR